MIAPPSRAGSARTAAADRCGQAGRERGDRRLVDLEFLTESSDVSVRDDAGGEGEERFVDVVAAFPTNS